MSKVLVTGSAGFIGFHLAKNLLAKGYEVIGIDNLNQYYDVQLKLDRLKELGINSDKIAIGQKRIKSQQSNFYFLKMSLEDKDVLTSLFEKEQFDIVINLAAQAGVRYSIDQPLTYIQSNIVGFANLLEACRHNPVKHLLYASSSSVYGNNKSVPFKTSDNVDHPLSLYAATKKSNELMAHSYSHLYNIPTTGLRFFTVYGEWGRPDMAAMLFAKAIMAEQPIKVFNHGKMSRDFTYVEDIVEGVIKVMDREIQKNNTKNTKELDTYRIYNIGNSKPVNLLEFIEILEEVIGKKAIKEMYPMQAGDVERTFADVSDLIEQFNYQPNTSLKKGLQAFADWYLKYYHENGKLALTLDNNGLKINKLDI